MDTQPPAVPSFDIIVLLVDDQAIIGEAVRRLLADEKDIQLHYCQDPTQALAMANRIRPTVILQDLVMPNVDGMTLVRFFRANAATRDVPMIVLSSREEPKTKAEAFANGANDYLVKLPDRLELVARIRYHSQGYIHLLERNATYNALVASQAALKAELDEAERYVRSLLPAKTDEVGFQTDWVFISSTSLGGDAFGYHALDKERMAIYLLDVCGHGVGAALLSVTAMNVLRGETLRSVDFGDPAAVLSAMNDTFDMEKHNQMYFTLWYGVWNRRDRTLSYASGGHPPAVLVGPDGSGTALQMLATPGMVVGGMPGVPYTGGSVQVEPGARLYVFSDGVYELEKASGQGMLTLEEFADELAKPAARGSKVPAMLAYSRAMQGAEAFEDDFSLLEIRFGNNA